MNGGRSLARQPLNEEACWEAVLKKENNDGEFFFGVLTTGIFCRPSCPARRPLRKNVRFYKTATEAIADNLRPCLRCRPLVTGRDDNTKRRIYALCDFIRKNSSEPLNLERLSQKAHLSPFHLQRTFKAVVGVTPRQYLEACRLETLKKQFRSGNSLTVGLWVQALIRHLSGDRRRLFLPIDVRGTAFQFRVWTYLQSIPYGEVQSYSEVARGIQNPGANRAVAQACASNKVAIAIPCHRVIRGNGEMGGYRWGVARKRTLIDLERSAKAAVA
jgi:O-6-methylguanine DNA methyltransferase